jgi:hypothetical protein
VKPYQKAKTGWFESGSNHPTRSGRPCAAATAVGASAALEMKSFFSTSFTRAAGDGAQVAGAGSDASVDALCGAGWRGGAGVEDEATGDVVEDGVGALTVTGSAGHTGTQARSPRGGAAGAGTYTRPPPWVRVASRRGRSNDFGWNSTRSQSVEVGPDPLVPLPGAGRLADGADGPALGAARPSPPALEAAKSEERPARGRRRGRCCC